MNDDHDVQYGVTHDTYGTCLVCGTTAGWSEDEQRFVHGRTSGLLAEGKGATGRPEPGVWITSPGEFAAVWNSHTPKERELWLRSMLEAARRGDICFQADHIDYIRHLEGEASRIMEMLNRINRVVWAPRKWRGRELRRQLRNVLRPARRGWF